MRIETDVCRQLATCIQNLQAFVVVPDDLSSTHAQVQNSLNRLTIYFSQLAASAETAEQGITFRDHFSPGTLKTTHSENWNLARQIKKQSAQTTFSGTLSKSWKEAQFRKSTAKTTFTSSLGVVSLQASGKAGIRIWKDKAFDPRLDAKVEGSLSALSGKASWTWKPASGIRTTISGKGEAGVLYGKCEAVLSKDEQSFEAALGAAALRGECSLAFTMFGASVTITGSGSIGSAEANISYHHRNREWEFGSKLGFIAGAGFKVKVNY